MLSGLSKTRNRCFESIIRYVFANAGGFKLKGRVTGGGLKSNPGEFANLDATVDDVKQSNDTLPFKEPSGTFI